MDAYCAEDESDGANLYNSIGKKDIAAISGLLARGRAFAVNRGDTATRVWLDGGLMNIRIRSGFHIGEDCWTLSNLLE